MRLAILLAVALFATPAAAVDAAPMDAAAMRAAFYGATLDGEYSDGLAWSETFSRSGRSVYAQEGARSAGRIAFRGPTICFVYEVGFDGGCFRVWRRSLNCFDFYGVDATDRPYATRQQQRAGTGWTARAWRTDAQSTCKAVPVG